jgi:hypothetical protein
VEGGGVVSEPDLLGEIPMPKAKTVELVVPSQTPVAITPMQMLQIAVERGSDIAMLEKLMGLQERHEATEARKEFVSALNAFKADAPTVMKNKSAAFGGKGGTAYGYVTLDVLCDVIGRALSEHGLSHRWEVTQADNKIRVTCILTHVRGHSERIQLEAGADTSGSKNNIQAIGSTVTYLERYTLLAATGLAARNQDDDGRAQDAINDGQKQILIDLMKETGADTKRFLDFMQVETIDMIPARRFQEAKSALEKKRKGATV